MTKKRQAKRRKIRDLNGVISHGVFSSFRARFSSFRVAHFVFSSFRLALFRLFVISLGVFSLFRLFAWRYFVLARRHNARRKDEERNNEMAQTSHHRCGLEKGPCILVFFFSKEFSSHVGCPPSGTKKVVKHGGHHCISYLLIS